MSVDNRLTVVTRGEQGRVVVELHGELDLAGAPLLTEELHRSQVLAAETLVLDLEDLQFLDSAGLRVILAIHEEARGRGQEFALTPGTPQVQRLLTIAGVSDHLQTISSPEAALLQGPQAPPAA
jgi:anti-sigma B factor antagonist